MRLSKSITPYIGTLLVLALLITLEGGAGAANLGPYSIISSRDIFDPARGLNKTKGGGDSLSESEVRKQVELLGVIITNGKKSVFARQKLAGVKSPASVSALSEGESIGGWHIEKIREREVVLKKGAQKVILPVFQREPKENVPVGLATPKIQAPGPHPVSPARGKIPSNYRIKRLQPSVNNVTPGSTYKNTPLVQRLLKNFKNKRAPKE